MQNKQFKLGPGRKECVVCGEMRAAADYVTGEDSTSTRCSECRVGKEDADTARRVFQYVKTVGKRLAVKARNAQLDVNKMHEIASGAMNRLGGLNGFTTLYTATLQTVLKDPRTKPKEKLDWLYSIVRMHESASRELQHLDQRDTDNMDIEDLEQELKSIVLKEIQEGLKVHDSDVA